MYTPPLSSSGRPPPGNSISPSPSANNIIPVLLLKTQSQPHDSYYEYFSTSPSPSASTRTPAGPGEDNNINVSSSFSSASLEDHASVAATGATTVTLTTLRFQPLFVPVLEHHPNTRSLDVLQDLLRSEQLAQKYGGMIFTSQRAVEAWSEVVKRVEGHSKPDEHHDGADASSSTSATGVGRLVQHHETTTTSQDSPTGTQPHPPPTHLNPAPQSAVDDDSIFPLYSVGPATSRALNTLVVASQSSCSSSSPFSRIRPSVLGEHTGNGANLAQYILSHYNGLHSRKLPTPFTGSSPNKEQLDLEASLPEKKGLLFLVGEQRRDIIPKTLIDKEGRLPLSERIAVDEVEVYTTGTMDSFQHDFSTHIDSFKQAGPKLVVVVVFSPQGCEAMLRSLGYIDDERRLTQAARERWQGPSQDDVSGGDIETAVREGVDSFSVVIATIGPTTRDHLKDEFGFEADVCAAKPSPQGVRDGVLALLREKKLIL